MTHEQLVRRLVKRTGYRAEAVRHFLQMQRTVIQDAIIQGEEVYFFGLFRVIPTEREMWVQTPSSARRKVKRVILKVRPTKTFRLELNKWTGEHMDKFGVVVDPSDSKTAGVPRTCPECGGSDVRLRGGVNWCPICGVKPWEPKEKDASDKEE